MNSLCRPLACQRARRGVIASPSAVTTTLQATIMYESVAYMPKSCSPLKYEIAYSGIFVFSDINASTTPRGELTSSKPHNRLLLKSGLSDVCTLALRASYPMVIANHPIIMTNNARMRL
ncbi:hypothetical protein D3C76_1210860 [compost metagenome]